MNPLKANAHASMHNPPGNRSMVLPHSDRSHTDRTKTGPLAFAILLCVIALASVLVPSAAAQVRGCPYDLLAMCCVKSKNGHCTDWKNCCSIYEATSQSDDATSSARPAWQVDLPIRDTPSRCEVDCRRILDDPADIELCIETCSQLAALPDSVASITEKLAPPWRPVRMVQLSGFQAIVPMYYGFLFPNHPDLDVEVRWHEVSDYIFGVSKKPNLDMAFRLDVDCPGQGTLESLAVVVPDKPLLSLVVDGSEDQYSNDQLILQPFRRTRFNQACGAALGGQWIVSEGHPDVDPIETTWIESTVHVIYRCQGDGTQVASFVAMTKASCIDQFDTDPHKNPNE